MVGFSFELDDHPHEECGVLAMYYPHKVNVWDVIARLQRQQNRGHEAFGLSYLDDNNGQVVTVRIPGLIDDLYGKKEYQEIRDLLDSLPKQRAWIGHVRYGTYGKKGVDAIKQAHPIILEPDKCEFHEFDSTYKDKDGTVKKRRLAWCLSKNGVALAFNGNLPDDVIDFLKQEIPFEPWINTDTEFLLQAYVQRGEDWILKTSR